MAHQVQWTTNLQITGGPTFSRPGSMTVDAYDHIQVLVKQGQQSAQVDLPGQSGLVQLVLITADRFDNLSYKIVGAPATPADPPPAAGTKKGVAAGPDAQADPAPAASTPAAPAAIPLDATQLFAGTGAVGRLGDAPISITFDNQGAQDANVEILVGRNTA